MIATRNIIFILVIFSLSCSDKSKVDNFYDKFKDSNFENFKHWQIFPRNEGNTEVYFLEYHNSTNIDVNANDDFYLVIGCIVRDNQMFDFDYEDLNDKVGRFLEINNIEVSMDEYLNSLFSDFQEMNLIQLSGMNTGAIIFTIDDRLEMTYRIGDGSYLTNIKGHTKIDEKWGYRILKEPEPIEL